jgi:hypothetical protein
LTRVLRFVDEVAELFDRDVGQLSAAFIERSVTFTIVSRMKGASL